MSEEFSILGFVAHLGVMGASMVAHEVHGLERAVKIVEDEAKSSLGTYQGQSGPFAGWDELATSTKEDRAAQGYPDNEPELRSGEMGASIEHTIITPGREAEVGSNSEILEWQELGTSKMPPRSIIGGAAARKEHAVAEALGNSVIAALIGEEVHQGQLPIF